MSVTIHQTPQDFTPSDNPIVWTFSSNQTAQTNFVYIVKLYINNVQVATEMVSPDNGIYARFDASAWCQNRCQPPTISQDIIVDANNYVYCKITVVERYGDPETDHATASSANIVAFKARMTDEDFIDWDCTDYIHGSGAKWLTNFPYTAISPKVRSSNESFRLMCLNNLANVTLGIKLYDDTGLIASGSYGFASAAFEIVIANVSPAVIVGEAIGINQTDFDNATYYTVEDTPEMTPFRIDIDRSCVYDRYRRLHFLSQWGSVEALSFGLESHVTGQVKSNDYVKSFGDWDGNGSKFVFKKTQSRSVAFAKTVDKKMIVVSDWLDEDVQHWLVDNMYSSPLVWDEDLSTGSLYPRKVLNSSFTHEYHDTGLLFMEQVELELTPYTSVVV